MVWQHRKFPRIGEIYHMQFTGIGNEQSGWRPGLVFQNNIGNRYSPNIVALPLTSSLKKLEQPTHVLLLAVDTGLKTDSVVLCENPQRMSKESVGAYITKLSDRYLREIAVASLLATSIIAYLDAETLLHTWKMAVRMNLSGCDL